MRRAEPAQCQSQSSNADFGPHGADECSRSHVLKFISDIGPAMSTASLAAAIMSSQSGLTKLQLGTTFERMNADRGASIANLVDAAQQNMKSLNNVAGGIGRQLNVSA
jgi:hypothetical protein